MNKDAREAVQWEVESVLDDQLPTLDQVSGLLQAAIHRELTDSLRPLFCINSLAEAIMERILDMLDYEEALGLLHEASGDLKLSFATRSKLVSFLGRHGIKVDGTEENEE